ncbi:MAG TPA: pitrilysin family protein [Terriglobales bacterium]|nr:pitrilysin family protein [Terriglobales bacterium]
MPHFPVRNPLTSEVNTVTRAAKKIALCLGMTFALAISAGAQVKLPKLQFTDQTLDNGLRVIIAPDHSAPVFGISVTYNTGSRNEREGRTGFAHLFEHMMFQGSKNIAKGEHMLLVANNGGSMNGSTNNDQTNYYEALPKNQLDLALFMEADRMKALDVNQANLDNQRNAVQEERRLRVDNQPYGQSSEVLQSMAYDNFPYHHSVIGSMDDLNAAKLEDLQEFFRIYYAPNNAVLVLAGDVDPVEALAKVKKHFGGIPRQPNPPPVDIVEPPHDKERRKTLTDGLARLPQFRAAFNVPSGNTSDNYALQVMSNIMSGGRSSRLFEKLVREKQLAANVNIFTEARRGPSLLHIVATPARGVKVEDLEAAIYAELETLKKEGVTAKEIDKARSQYLRGQVQTRASSLGLANRLASNVIYFNDPNLINTSVDKYNAVTAEQVKAVAQKYLVPEQRTVVITMPAGRGAASAPAAMQ